MKNLFVILVAVVFSAGFVFAQNTATTTETGNYNDAFITQIGSNINGIVIQTGNSNYAQQHVTGWDDNTESEVIGHYNKTWQFIRSGSYNDESTILAIGNWNKVKTDQNGHDNFSEIKLNWSGFGTADYNDVNVKQVSHYNHFELGITRGDLGGDVNKVDVDQVGIGHWHKVNIDGSSNDIRIYAKGNYWGSQYIGNRGVWNFIDGSPLWTETSDYNEFDLVQDGTKNYATGIVAGDYNDIDITQKGDYNNVGTSWYTTDGIVVTGNRNTAGITQTGDLNTGTITQTGDWNTGTITSVGNGHTGTITQTGGQNEAVITQNP